MKRLLGAILLSLLLVSAACTERRNEGTMEKVGREIDDAVGDAKEEKKGVADKVGEGLKDLGDKIEDQG